MSTQVLPAPVTRFTPVPSADKAGWFLPAVLGLYWAQFFIAVHTEWSINPQYQYGWFVPLLAAGLLWRRWGCRPQPHPPAVGARRDVSLLALAVVLVLLVLPFRIILEANPEWRRFYWHYAPVPVVISLLAVWYQGGRPWLKHFAFPVLFLLIAVPWPGAPEAVLTKQLMRGIATVTVEVVGMLGVPAVQQGHVLQIGTGTVGVDEACSGVRSFHTSIMLSLFLGELFMLRVWRRVGLVGLAVLVALLANLARTSFLTWAAARHGFDRMNSWHDAAGVSVVLVTLFAIWLIARLLRTPDVPAHRQEPAAHAPVPTPRWPHPFCRPMLIGLALWVPVVEGANEAWYRLHEHGLIESSRWQVAWPETQAGFRESPISPRAKLLLRCHQSRSAVWRDNQGYQWNLVYLQWEPRSGSSNLGRGHSPDICLSGAGWKITKELGALVAKVHGMEFPFRAFEFAVSGQTAYVYHLVWDDRTVDGRQIVPNEFNLANRLQAAWGGKRMTGQRSLEIALVGPSTPEEAWSALQAQLDRIIQPVK